jgi:hypothetical protein
MFTDTRIADINGPLLYWGPSRFNVRATAAPPSRTSAHGEPAFGDLNGPLAYWGPVAAPSRRPSLARASA